MFRCRHWRSNTTITWRVNGSTVSQFPGIVEGSVRENGTTIVNTLTIPARSEYNGTCVTCLAIFPNTSYEETLPAILTVIPAEQMTLEPKALPDPVLGFEAIPSPTTLMLTIGETYTFVCNHSETHLISWRVNGSGLGTEIYPQNITHSFIPFSDGRGVYTLTIESIPENNRTKIQCKAAFSNGSAPVMSQVVTILIQG